MAVRTQFNSSTLKVIYNSGTSKVQVVPCVCTLCSTVPYEITVTFSDLIEKTDCCNYTGSYGASKIYDGGIAAVLNGAHVLECNGSSCTECGSGVAGECCWSKTVLGGSFGTVDIHSVADCGNLILEYPITSYIISVIIYESGGVKYTDVRVIVLSSATCIGTSFADKLTFVDAADCLNLGNTFTNEITTCDEYTICTGGTAVLSL